MPTEDGPLTLRPAVDGDAPALAVVHVASRRSATMPANVHPDDHVRRWLAERLRSDDTWVAEVGGRVVGYVRLADGWLDDLYVHPDHAGAGVGSALLDLAKSRQPGGFSLWVFETNHEARRFYARRGLVELERTDGTENEERAPDLRMTWPGSDPVRHLRGLIDDVDEQLARLLARRAALTAAVQPYKDDPDRDLARERAIAAAMAHHAPALGVDRLERIVHAIVTESLDAAGG